MDDVFNHHGGLLSSWDEKVHEEGGGGGLMEFSYSGEENHQKALWRESINGMGTDYGFMSHGESGSHGFASQGESGSHGESGETSSQETCRKRIKSAQLNPRVEKIAVDDAREESGPLGLKLKKTPSLINLLETALSERWRAKGKEVVKVEPKMNDFVSQPMSEKLKASNFPALLLRIGGFELNQPPLLQKEQDPQPRKHTQWESSEDFTGGYASKYRRHYVKFPPGTLDRHYEKLLQNDSRLLTLSQRGFPSHKSPWFRKKDCGPEEFSVDFNGSQIQIDPRLQYSPYDDLLPVQLKNMCLPARQTLGIANSNSPAVSNFGLDKQMVYLNSPAGSNFPLEDGNMVVWNEANIANNEDYVRLPNQNFNALTHLEGTGMAYPGLSSAMENYLLDHQVICSNEKMFQERRNSMYSLPDPLEVAKGKFIDEKVIVGAEENPMLNAGLGWEASEPMPWFGHHNHAMQQTTNANSFSPYDLPNQIN